MSLEALDRFTQVVSRPFTAHDFIALSGTPAPRALKLLKAGDKAGVIALVTPHKDPAQMVFVPRPRIVRKSYYDFRPSRSKLQAILDIMQSGSTYDSYQLSSLTNMSIRSIQRYLHMLSHLGCVKSSLPPVKKHGRISPLYTLIHTDLPLIIPPYFATCSPAYKRSSLSTPKEAS